MRLLTKTTALATLLLIFVGSLVTSTGSGLAVPDWPLSYGTLFPPMVGGILYEHGHRMAAAVVGLLVVVQALVLTWGEPRRWVRVLAWVAVGAIVAQGLLGGLTVLFLLPTPISMTHAVLAQTLFLVLILIAHAQSGDWSQRLQERTAIAWRSIAALLGVVYLQLLLGALMRHTGAGLAIPDFPLMGGTLLPRFDERMLNAVNAARFDLHLPSVALGQVIVHFLHRLGALATLVVLVMVNLAVGRRPAPRRVRQLLGAIDGLVVVQVALGALTVITARSPLLASLHVLVGASLLGATWWCLLCGRPVRERTP
ncbi:MAG: COX15/CtaA family protein [Spirochaetaceae bacterium]|nr:COX15/CtaA family protein [Spirochaetaceae bacterium]